MLDSLIRKKSAESRTKKFYVVAEGGQSLYNGMQEVLPICKGPLFYSCRFFLPIQQLFKSQRRLRMLQLCVIDDEIEEARKIQNMLTKLLGSRNESSEISVYQDAHAFLATFTRGRYDIIFLDIQMPEMDGMTCAQEIRRRDSSVILIFITSMVQYAVQGYRVEATDYLVKPVEPTLLAHSLHRALKHLNKHQKLTIRSSDGLHSLNTDDLLYVEAVNHRVILHTTREIIHCSQTMAAIETQLQGCGFFRCHQGFLVNMKQIQHIDGNNLFIADKAVPISKYRRREFMQELTAYWGKTL
ncbi:MAG: LytR/AlgR family response regulator transcription factor [Faecousia sp.]